MLPAAQLSAADFVPPSAQGVLHASVTSGMLLCSGLVVHAPDRQFLRDTRGTPLSFASHVGNNFVIRDMLQRHKIDKPGACYYD